MKIRRKPASPIGCWLVRTESLALRTTCSIAHGKAGSRVGEQKLSSEPLGSLFFSHDEHFSNPLKCKHTTLSIAATSRSTYFTGGLSASMAPKSTNSGIQKLSNGESVIPASTRSDGSVRKEIRVKPGYKPPEDVEVYKNRTAEAWKTRGKAGVPGAQVVRAEEKEAPHKAAANKNAKRREARKKALAATAEETEDHEGEEKEITANGDTAKTNGNVSDAVPEEVDPDAERAKEARKLAKKLRQARELQEKEEKGDSLLPEQFAKVIKINELIRQLDNLGFDAEGAKKEQPGGQEAEG